MKSLHIISISLCLLLAGCVGSSTKHPEASVALRSKSAMSDFTGTYNDLSESTKGERRSLASILRIYHRTPAPDSLVITNSPGGDLFGEATLDSAVLARDKIWIEGPIIRGRLPLGSGRGDSGGFFSSGKEKFRSFLYVTKEGNLALEYSSTFSGTFLFFPAYGTQTSVYLWKKTEK